MDGIQLKELVEFIMLIGIVSGVIKSYKDSKNGSAPLTENSYNESNKDVLTKSDYNKTNKEIFKRFDKLDDRIYKIEKDVTDLKVDSLVRIKLDTIKQNDLTNK